MKTVLEVINATSAHFERRGIESARLDAELLLAARLGLPRLQLYLQFERPLSETELAPLREMVRRRAAREPLQRILGAVEFHDVRLATPPGVLIPRPETEELVEHILADLQPPPSTLLDLGCGTGAIGIALLRKWPDCAGTFADSSAAARAATAENLAANRISGAHIVESNWFESIEGSFGVIVSNPPYLTEDEIASAEPEVREHEPLEALGGGGPDGLDAIRVILAGAPSHLAPGGLLYLETGIEQPDAIRAEAVRHGLNDCTVWKDLSGRPRFMRLRR